MKDYNFNGQKIQINNIPMHKNTARPESVLDFLFFKVLLVDQENFLMDFYKVNSQGPEIHFVIKIEDPNHPGQKELNLTFQRPAKWSVTNVGDPVPHQLKQEIIAILETYITLEWKI